MEANEIPQTTPVPNVLKCIGKACDLVSHHAQLLLLPILLDLFLLFGPKLRIDSYLQPFINALNSRVQHESTALALGFEAEDAIELIGDLLSSVNLFGMVRTIPIGVDVLYTISGPDTPLGKSPEIEMRSLMKVIPILIAVILLGIILGCLYYALVSRETEKKTEAFSLSRFARQVGNICLFYMLLLVLLVILLVPAGCMTTAAMMLSPTVYEILLILLLAIGCWLMIPFFYTPHEIFAHDRNLPEAVKASFRLASWSSTLTVRYVVVSVFLTSMTNMIWTIPPQKTWLALFAIFGHAFVSTALLAASFIFFRELSQWQEENSLFLEWRRAKMHIKKVIKKEPEKNE